jgi:hypothetical protein
VIPWSGVESLLEDGGPGQRAPGHHERQTARKWDSLHDFSFHHITAVADRIERDGLFSMLERTTPDYLMSFSPALLVHSNWTHPFFMGESLIGNKMKPSHHYPLH